MGRIDGNSRTDPPSPAATAHAHTPCTATKASRHIVRTPDQPITGATMQHIAAHAATGIYIGASGTHGTEHPSAGVASHPTALALHTLFRGTIQAPSPLRPSAPSAPAAYRPLTRVHPRQSAVTAFPICAICANLRPIRLSALLCVPPPPPLPLRTRLSCLDPRSSASKPSRSGCLCPSVQICANLRPIRPASAPLHAYHHPQPLPVASGFPVQF